MPYERSATVGGGYTTAREPKQSKGPWLRTGVESKPELQGPNLRAQGPRMRIPRGNRGSGHKAQAQRAQGLYKAKIQSLGQVGAPQQDSQCRDQAGSLSRILRETSSCFSQTGCVLRETSDKFKLWTCQFRETSALFHFSTPVFYST